MNRSAPPDGSDGLQQAPIRLARVSPASLRLSHLRRREQFQWVMSAPPVLKTAHFALHLAAPTPDVVARSCATVTDAIDAAARVQTGARSLFEGVGPWIGVLLPKRWARRAVTRNTLRRQIYAVAQDHVSGLPHAALVVRLRHGFDRQQFVSATSDALKTAARAELVQLFGRLLERHRA